MSFLQSAVAGLLNMIEGSGGALCMALAGLAAIASFALWLPINAFLTRWWWGALTFLLPLASPVFAYYHWQRARQPILVGFVCTLLATGIFAARSFVQIFFSEAA